MSRTVYHGYISDIIFTVILYYILCSCSIVEKIMADFGMWQSMAIDLVGSHRVGSKIGIMNRRILLLGLVPAGAVLYLHLHRPYCCGSDC